MIAATIGETEASDDFVAFVHRRTKGNPYFIAKVLQTLGGRYRLLRQIGAGGMGRVFEAVDTLTGERVAAKLMMARTEAGSHALQRFEQEGQVLSSVRHPNIVEVRGTFLDEHASCIVMELIEGQSLGQLMQHESLNLSQTKAIVEQVVAALVCAHDSGIVHRDIKPDNIMVCTDGRVKVTDFGIARMLRPVDMAMSMTTTGMTLGTPLYVAPEQIRGGKVDGRADIYSLGAVLYQIVTGKPPFMGEDPIALGVQHLQDSPIPPTRFNPGLPPDWEALILMMLEKDPAHRYQSASSLQEATASLGTAVSGGSGGSHRASHLEVPAMTRALESPQEGTSTVNSTSDDTRRTRKFSRRSVRIFTAIGVAVLLIAAVLMYVNRSFRGTQNIRTIAVQFKQLEGLALDSRGNIFAVDFLGSLLDKLSPNGTLLAQFPISPPERFQGEEYSTVGPYGIVLDGRGNLFVADYGYHGIQELSQSGKLTAPWPYQINVGQPVAFGPTGLARDPTGNLYAADPLNNRILKFSPSGDKITIWKNLGSVAGDLQGPTGVAVDLHGLVYIADTRNERIVSLSPGGRPLHYWGGVGTGPGQFESPAGLAVDSHGNLYVADTDNHRIQELSPSGHFIAQWGGAGSHVRFNQPIDVKVDPQGNLFVADSANNVIEKLSHTGKLLATWGKSASAK